MKKSLRLAVGLAAVLAAGTVSAVLNESVNYEYLDDQGFTVGSGYKDCNGRLYVEGQRTNNLWEVSREPCKVNPGGIRNGY
jgi:hypothetical protein